ncbi:hypothetical protein A1Q2_00192 [Trichosporon asahii var. asahii CBS 8904]|uniref:Uncharacterized protein n=1 Tax=Trichosporon asahii var. asahii (strain CBS 8904) TaxID=1220162 RepID=K1VXY3_TRIAC|nr:hypothetical protein A1Q2_00192 [Trichosporon asahii var. asahii CBS 8904]
MSDTDSMTVPEFWACIDAAWSPIPGAASARAAFLHADRSIRNEALKTLDRLFGQAFQNLIRDLCKRSERQLFFFWNIHWLGALQDISLNCCIYDNEAGEVTDDMRLRSFVVLVGEAAAIAFGLRRQDYINYKPKSMHMEGLLCIDEVVQQAQLELEASKDT